MAPSSSSNRLPFVILLISIGIAIQLGLSAADALISSENVLNLAECYKRYKYERTMPEEEIQKLGFEAEGEEQMKKIMDKHFEIENFFGKCMEDQHKENAKKFAKFQAKIFQKSKIDAWLKNAKKMLAKEFGQIGQNVKKEDGTDDVDEEGKPRKKSFKGWRRMLMPYGLLGEAFQLGFVKILLDKVLGQIQQKKRTRSHTILLTHLEWASKRMHEEAQNNQHIALLSFLRRFLEKQFLEAETHYANMEKMLQNEEIEWNSSLENIKFAFPKVKRVVWLFRHAHRFDNLEGKKDLEYFEVDDRRFEKDNSPLSTEGKEMAAKLAPILGAIPVKEMYASPFERTVQTAHLILGKTHPEIGIRLEPGLLESLHKSKGEPTYQSCEELREAGHERLDCEYKGKFDKSELMRRCAAVEFGDRDDACMGRSEQILERILFPKADKKTSKVGDKRKEPSHGGGGKRQRHGEGEGAEGVVAESKWGKKEEWVAPGEEDAVHIVLVTHGTMILGMQQYFDGKFNYVPQLSITKLVEMDEGKDAKKGQSSKNPLHNFHMVFVSETKHLANEQGEREKKLYKWK